MDRVLKFRAWDRERSMFVPQGEIVFSDYGDTDVRVEFTALKKALEENRNG